MARRNTRTNRNSRLGTSAEEAKSGAVDNAGRVGIVRRFFELAEDLCVVVDLDGVVRYANQAWTSVLGRAPGEVVGRHLGTFLEVNDGDRAGAAARDAVRDEFLHGFEKRFVHRDGSARWIQWSIQVDHEEKVAYGIGRDTTTRHEAEAALAASEQAYRSLIDGSLDGMILAGAGGDVILANPAIRAMLGHPPDHVTTWNRADVVDPNDVSLQTYIEERERTGRAQAELTLRRVDGTTFPANIFSASFTDADGQKHTSVVVRDVSTEQRLRDALTGSASRMTLQAAALEAAANAIVITDPNGTIEWVNPAFTAMTGYEQHEAIGRKPSLLKSGVHDERYYRELWATITAGRPWHGELMNRRKDGSLYQEEQTITPVRDGTATIHHYIAIKQDVSARHASEQALRDSEDSFRKLFQRNPLPLYVYDATTLAFLAVNDAMVQHYGYSEHEFLAMDLTDIRPPGDGSKLLTYLEERPDHRDGNEGVWIHALKDGTVIDVAITTYTLTFQRTQARLVVAQDITEQLAAREQLARMAFVNSLTGLANRNGFVREIDRFIQTNGWPEHGVVLLIDIDHFQRVNDAHGFASGGAVLQSIAKRLRDHLSADAILSHADGDTFATSIGLDLQPYVDSHTLTFHAVPAWTSVAEEHVLALQNLIHDMQPKVLVIDPVSALFKTTESDNAYLSIEQILTTTHANGVTTILTSLLHHGVNRADETVSHTSTLADTWIALDYSIIGGERNRALSIVKSRGTRHSNQVRENFCSQAKGSTLPTSTTSAAKSSWERHASSRRTKMQTSNAGP